MMPTLSVFAQLIGVYHFLESAPGVNVFVAIGFIIIIGATILQSFPTNRCSDSDGEYRSEEMYQ
jgi:hypothetical protein